jgi:hypothetical protein
MAKKLNRTNLTTIVSVAILVGVEILGASLALGWALGGLLGLSDTLRAVLVGSCLALGAYVLFVFMRQAVKAEPIHEPVDGRDPA